MLAIACHLVYVEPARSVGLRFEAAAPVLRTAFVNHEGGNNRAATCLWPRRGIDGKQDRPTADHEARPLSST
jgi:hypothetical protein